MICNLWDPTSLCHPVSLFHVILITITNHQSILTAPCTTDTSAFRHLMTTVGSFRRYIPCRHNLLHRSLYPVCVLQCNAVDFNVLQCISVCGIVYPADTACCTDPSSCKSVAVCCSVLQCVAVRCGALRCVAVRCGALQCVAVRCSALRSVLQCVCVAVRCAVCCSVLQCVAVCCSVLQCVLYRHSLLHWWS